MADKHFTHKLTIITILVWAIPALASFGTAADIPPSDRNRMAAALMWGIIPGGGHYYLGEHKTGTAYAGSILSLVGASAWLDDRNRKLEHHDEVNSLWLLAIKEWELSLFTTYRSAYRSSGNDLKSVGVDDSSLGNLFLSPFKKENLFDPAIYLAGLFGIAAAVYDSRNAKNDFSDIERVGILGTHANRECGLGLYSADAFAISLAAGVSEEALWRGVLQNEMEMTLGKREGLWTTASIFGAAHIVDLDGDINLGRAGFATLAGLYLGHMFQKNKHRLSKPIAAHFWYNFAVMMTAFALDPDNNPLGVKISFRY
jgi:membrane protease YdiL (CAAX protease family)